MFVNILGMRMIGRQGIVDGHRWAFAGPLQYSTVSLAEVSELQGGDVAHALLRRGRVEGAPPEGLPAGDTVLVLTARRHGETWIAVSAANVAVSSPPGT